MVGSWQWNQTAYYNSQSTTAVGVVGVAATGMDHMILFLTQINHLYGPTVHYHDINCCQHHRWSSDHVWHGGMWWKQQLHKCITPLFMQDEIVEDYILDQVSLYCNAQAIILDPLHSLWDTITFLRSVSLQFHDSIINTSQYSSQLFVKD